MTGKRCPVYIKGEGEYGEPNVIVQKELPDPLERSLKTPMGTNVQTLGSMLEILLIGHPL